MRFILRLQCPDRKGIVAAVSGALSSAGCNIEDAAQFNSPSSAQFFMRVVFTTPDIEEVRSVFPALAEEFSMQWNIYGEEEKVPTLILVSHGDHCLHDILYRWRTGHLSIDIKGIVSNHETNRPIAAENGIPFHYLPVTSTTKNLQEEKLDKILVNTGTELIVLARYMQILSDSFSRKYEGRIINIHHSFLPGFKGAKPYHQAWERGVKIIGATAHFVTADLDEGPIIEQDIVRISHALGPEKMQILGKDTESRVLSRALQLYAERRVFLHGNRTVIL